MQFIESVLEAGFVPMHLQVFNYAVGVLIVGLLILLAMGRSTMYLNLLLAIAATLFVALQWFVMNLPEAAWQENLKRLKEEHEKSS